MLVLGCVAGLALHLELGIGPTEQIFAVDTYNRLFTVHGAVMLYCVLRPGLLAPVAASYVARAREAQGLAGGLGAALSSFGALAMLGVAIVAGTVVVFELAPSWLRWIVGLAALADLGLGLGVLIGMIGLDARRSPVLHFTVVTVALAQALLGGIDLLANEGQSVHTTSAFGALQWVLLVGFAVVSASASEHSRLGTCAAVAMLAVVLVHQAAFHTFWGAEPKALAWASGIVQTSGYLVALVVIARSLRRGVSSEPTWDVTAVLVVTFLLQFAVHLYVDSIKVDVHISDSYIVVADFHLLALLGPAIGGPLALRHFHPERYATTPVWLRRTTPWLLGIALIWFGLALFALGHQGMPRRYYAYLPEYLAGHRSAAAAAVTLCVGMVLEAILWLRGSERDHHGDHGQPDQRYDRPATVP
jgi:heme/copper-type cytochrome/quinol oxidase subunit 1